MTGRKWTMDCGGAPWGEDCAQVGHTENFAVVNHAEAAIYKAALFAVAGLPPAGITLRIKANAHDFGTYRTVEAVIDETSCDTRPHAQYLDTVEAGVEFWLRAGFQRPDFATLNDACDTASFVASAIMSAMRITRPGPTGQFFPRENEQLHGNLIAAYPQLAERAFEGLRVSC